MTHVGCAGRGMSVGTADVTSSMIWLGTAGISEVIEGRSSGSGTAGAVRIFDDFRGQVFDVVGYRLG
jgi:hypothetical protein